MPTPVLIAGAGPTGLTLAIWLKRLGICFRIIDKNSGPGQASRAMVVQARTLEFYRQIGIADAVIQAGIPMDSIHLLRGAREIAHYFFGDIGAQISPYQYVLSLPQDDHERLLVSHLEKLGVQIEWNTRLESFEDLGDSVRARLSHEKAPGAAVAETAEFSFLCGCDGARSVTRQSLGIGFPGGTYEHIFYVADVAMDRPDFERRVNVSISGRTICLVFPVRSSGMFRLIGIVPHNIASRDNLTFEDVREGIRQQIGGEVTTVNWFSTYHIHHRVAETFRKGRAFLAGDAGHIHSPAGGQGMNTGIGDAVNLAWKLAAVLQGRAAEAILDTYSTERTAFAQVLVNVTDRIFDAVVGRGPGPHLVRSLFIPFIAPVLLRMRRIRRSQFRLVSQVRIRYPHSVSTLSRGRAGAIHGGDRLPWLAESDNFAALSSLDWQLHVAGEPSIELRRLAKARGIALHSFPFDAGASRAGFERDAAYLIRPDGHVAVAASGADSSQIADFLEDWKIVPVDPAR